MPPPKSITSLNTTFKKNSVSMTMNWPPSWRMVSFKLSVF